MGTPSWIQYNEDVVGENHPSKTDVANRPVKTIHANMLVGHDADGKHVRLIYGKSTKTADYSILTTDAGSLIELGSAAAAAKTFTLPSVGSDEDGLIVHCGNDSGYKLTIKPSDTDSVWNSGAGYGIELPDRGTMVGLRYDHANTKWDVVYKVGGRVMIEGLKLHLPMDWIGRYTVADQDHGYGTVYDASRSHGVTVRDGTQAYGEGYSQYPPGCWALLSGNAQAYVGDHADWDIFGNQTGAKTISFWAWHAGSGSDEGYVSQYEDANNYWQLRRYGTDSTITLAYSSGGGSEIWLTGSGVIAATTWTHIGLIIVGVDVGLYVNGTQYAYDGSWNTDTFAGQFYIGQRGSAQHYLVGRMQDLVVIHQNIFNAAPNVGLTDTITIPAAPFVGMMGRAA